MSDRRQLSAFHIQFFDIRHLVIDRQWGNAHDPATAFAMIALRLYIILVFCTILQSRQTCVARSSSGIQLRHIQQPGTASRCRKTFILTDFLQRGFLCFQPVFIGPHDITSGPAPNTPHSSSGITNQQAICRKQRHLCIV